MPTSEKDISQVRTYLEHRVALLRGPMIDHSDLNPQTREILMFLRLYSGSPNPILTPSPWITPTAICKTFGYSPAYTSDLISSLESQGYTEKSTNSKDKRSVNIALTERGQRAADSIIECITSQVSMLPIGSFPSL